MRINSLSIKNYFLGWEFEDIEFTSNLTLLVGGSGVGKTQILRAIDDLKDIVNGDSINGFDWVIVFSIDSGATFRWEGAFSTLEDSDNVYSSQDEEDAIKPTILFEKLINLDKDKIIINRTSEKIFFLDFTMPRLSSTQSILHILKEEKQINEVVSSFNKITLKDHTSREGFSFSSLTRPLGPLREKYKTFKEIRKSNESIRLKMFLCSELNFKIFDKIKARFKDIFPQIQDVRIELMENEKFPLKADFTMPVISIKEKGVSKWIRENRMSSGMLRTIIHIAELLLSSEGSIILIDEFENSLGVNCLDILTDDLIHENTSLQFIATSHHPYIINNIPYEYWKIVSRKGGKISVRDAAAHKLGKSRQAAFLQLTKILEKQAAAI